MRGQFWCKFGFCSSRKVWFMRGYGLREVWVKRGSTVVVQTRKHGTSRNGNRLSNNVKLTQALGSSEP